MHFAHLTPWAAEVFSSQGMLPLASESPFLYLFPNILAFIDAPWFVTGFVFSAALASVFFGVGCRDKIAGLWIWYVAACLFGRNPLTLNPSLPFMGWLLIAHAFIQGAPFGSIDARGRVDPRGDWKLPPGIFVAAWIVMALGYTYSGITKFGSPSWIDGTAFAKVLENPLARPTILRDFMLALPMPLLKTFAWAGLFLEVAFAPLALSKKMRPLIWLAALVMHLSLIVLIDFADLSFGMVILHLFTFNPDWIRPVSTHQNETIYFDGGCGLCQGWVRFVLAEDSAGTFKFGPLQGKAFAEDVSEEERKNLPDSIVVKNEEGVVLTKTRAIRYILARLGGYWSALSAALGLVPLTMSNFAYDFIASIRHQIFTKPKELCPLMPKDLRARFFYD